MILVHVASNCSDQKIHLPYMELDRSEPMNLYVDVGFCTDVLEYIPVESWDDVIANIMYLY